MHPLFAESERGEFIGYAVRGKSRWNGGSYNRRAVRISFMRIVNAGEKIQRGVVGLNGMVTETAAVDSAQIHVLQHIAHEVHAREGEYSRLQIVLVLNSRCDQVGHGAGSRQGVVGVDRAHVNGKFVVLGGMHGIEGQSQIIGIAIAASQRETYIRSAVPA